MAINEDYSENEKIGNLADLSYGVNGNILIASPQTVLGWDLIAQELRVMMISDENSIGTNAGLAIDIRQFADGAASIESAEIIQDWIEEKIAANPLFDGLGLTVEIVPLDGETFEIVFKHPDNDTPDGGALVDLDFAIKIDTNRGVITGFLDSKSEGAQLYLGNPRKVTEFRRINKTTTILNIEYIPVDEEAVLLYNIADIQIKDGEIITESTEEAVTIDLTPHSNYSLVDLLDTDLSTSLIDGYELTKNGVPVDKGSYSLVNNYLVIPSSSSIIGEHVLSMTFSKRYADVVERTRISRDPSSTFVYPFLRSAEYRLTMNKALVPGNYILQYYVYGDKA